MQNAIKAALLAVVMISSGSLIAQVRAPWDMPKTDFGGAVPKHSEKWVTPSDYPPSALRNNEQGFVVVNFDITADGKVANCKMTRSSGHIALDVLPCRLLKQRARFDPATDANGVATATRGAASFPFWLP